MLVDADMRLVRALAAPFVPVQVFHLTDRGLLRPEVRADFMPISRKPAAGTLLTNGMPVEWSPLSVRSAI